MFQGFEVLGFRVRQALSCRLQDASIRVRGALLTLLLAVVMASGAAAQMSPARTTGPERGELSPAPKKVDVGIYLQDVRTFDLKRNEFTAVFWIWFRWTGDLQPLETFEIIGGEITSRHGETIEVADDGSKYGIVRVTATIHEPFDLRRFPSDNHSLIIKVEDTDADNTELVFVADSQNSTFNPSITVPGWKVMGGSGDTGVSTYQSNYGDTSIPTGSASKFSSFEYKLTLSRDGYWYLIKLLFPTYCAVAISLLAFLISADKIEPRMALGVGAVFAAIANTYVMSQSLPDSQVITLSDAISNTSTLVIVLGLVVSTASVYLFDRGEVDKSNRLDSAALTFTSVGYLVANIVLIKTW